MTAEVVHVITTLPARAPQHVQGRVLAVDPPAWTWTRGDGVWWCSACRCRVLHHRCTNVLCVYSVR